jgi:predicted nucleic acid-binding protein
VILVDAGPLIAAANRNDRYHADCVRTLIDARGPRLVSPLVIAEVCYLLARDGGAAPEAAFLRSFATGFLTVAELTAGDLARAAELVERYADLPLGGTDASVVALAERLGVADVATLDARHFRVVRPANVQAFTLLPADAD